MCSVTTSTLSRGLLLLLRASSSSTAAGSWFAISVGVVAPPTDRLISSSFPQAWSGFGLSDGEQSKSAWSAVCRRGTYPPSLGTAAPNPNPHESPSES